MGVRLALASLALVACGGKSQPPQPIGHHVAPVAAATCSDVGIILRGRVDGGEDAGRAREAAIANACEIDKWSSQIVQCVASERLPGNCLAKLGEKQLASYNEKMAEWRSQYGGDEYGGADYGGNDGMDAPPEIACHDSVGAADRYTPVPKIDESDALWDRALRRHALEDLCEDDNWDDSVRTCLGPTPDLDNSACLQALPLDARTHITEKLGGVDALVAKVIDARKKKPDCKKVVAAHYADAQWKGKLAQLKGKDRTKVIADSRDRMAKACKDDKWDDTTRACFVATDGESCLVAAGETRDRWRFPAAGVIAPTGVPECDEVGAEMTKILACDKFPRGARDAMEESYEQMSSLWAKPSPDANLATACKQVADAVKQARTSMGCP